MKQAVHTFRLNGQVLAMLFCIAACTSAKSPSPAMDKVAMQNPVYHFEIPVTDMERAIRFYQDVLGYELTRQQVDGYEMAFFPRADGKPGASGALAKGDVYVPSKTGAIIYFDVPDIDPILEKAKAKGAKVLYPKKSIGEAGFVAEIEDSEGNRIALNALND
jgi:predicted enzyme related to lactoylglutathione lyase